MSQCLLDVKSSQKRRSLPPVTQSFATPFLIVSSICLQLMLQSFIDQFCPFCLRAVFSQTKTIRVIAAVLIPPLANLNPTSYPAPCKTAPLNQQGILLMTERHQCPHIRHQVWISVNDPRGLTSWSTNAENRLCTNVCVKTAYAIQYSCCKRLVHLWKKDHSNNKFGEKCALSTLVDANPSIAIDWSSFETLPVAPEK